MNKYLRSHSFEIFACLLFVLLFSMTIHYTMDDSYITFVYSRNLLETGSITYNGINVEGYSSFLYVLIGALLMLPGIGLFPYVLKIYSVILGIAYLILAGKAIGMVSKSRPNKILGMIVLASSPFFVFNVQTGMDTPLIYLINIFIVLLIIYKQKTPLFQYIHWVFLLIFIGMLARPDFVLFTVPLAFYFFLFRKDSVLETIKKSNWKFISLIFIGGIIYLLFKKIHFGDVLPNPFYVKKAVAATGNRFFIQKLLEFSILNPVIPALITLMLFKFKKHWRFLLVILSLFVYTLAFYRTNFWQDHYFRYFSPLIFLYTIAFYGFLTKKHFGNLTKSLRMLLSGLIIFANLTIMINVFLYTNSCRYPIQVRHTIGKTLSKLDSGNIIMTCGDAGAIPFHSQEHNIDYYFLNSKLLTQNRLEDDKNAYWGLDTELLFSQDVDVLVLTSTTIDGFIPGYGGNRGLAHEISKNPKFKNYFRIAVLDGSLFFTPFIIRNRLNNFRPHHNPYYYHVMVTKDRPELLKELYTRFDDESRKHPYLFHVINDYNGTL